MNGGEHFFIFDFTPEEDPYIIESIFYGARAEAIKQTAPKFREEGIFIIDEKGPGEIYIWPTIEYHSGHFEDVQVPIRVPEGRIYLEIQMPSGPLNDQLSLINTFWENVDSRQNEIESLVTQDESTD